MLKTILGTKGEMTSKFTKAGRIIPVTYVVADTNVVAGVREDKVILAYGKKKKAKKTENAFVKGMGFAPRFIKEIKLTEQKNQTLEGSASPKINIGDKITVSIFTPGDEVKVTGVTRGKGFAGGVKRWGFAGGPKTHGQSDRHRAPGSIGAGTTPGRVFKGKKMAGHMGNQQLTVRGLEVIEVDSIKNILVIKGSVPGAKNGFVIVEKTGKVKGYTPPPPPKEDEMEEVKKEEVKKEQPDQKPTNPSEKKEVK